MSERNYSERRECGCRITLVEDCGELESIVLDYCPKHKATDAMYEALGEFVMAHEPGKQTAGFAVILNTTLDKARNALALADGAGGE